MPLLNTAFLSRDFKKDPLVDAIDGMDPAFQQTVETEMATLADHADTIDAKLTPTLFQLDQCLATLCQTHVQLVLKNIPPAIVTYLQTRINLMPDNTARLLNVYIDDHDEPWQPEYSYITVGSTSIDAGDDAFSDDDDGFIFLDPTASMLITKPADAKTVNPSPSPEPSLGHGTSLTDSLSSLSGSEDLEALRKSLELANAELKSSEELVAQNTEQLQQHMTNTKTTMHKLVAHRLLNRFDARQTQASKFKSYEGVAEYQALSEQNFRTLALTVNGRFEQSAIVQQKNQPLEEKIARLKQERETLSQKILSQSCPPSFFKKTAQDAAPVTLHQSVILTRDPVSYAL